MFIEARMFGGYDLRRSPASGTQRPGRRSPINDDKAQARNNGLRSTFLGLSPLALGLACRIFFLDCGEKRHDASIRQSCADTPN